MSDKMTSVYSGGLMYEYSQEPNKFGIVEIAGGQDNGSRDQTGERTELDEFAAFAAALKKYPAPTGDGGYTKTTKSSACPTKDANWALDTTELPEIPTGALEFFDKGAGKGPGLNGPGSQWATDQASPSDSEDDSGSGTGTGSGAAESSSSAAMRGTVPAFNIAPLAVSGVVLLCTMIGAAAL